MPDIIVGDFDSADPVLLETYRRKGIGIRTYPVDKDETDTELAAQAVIKAGADRVFILAGWAVAGIIHMQM